MATIPKTLPTMEDAWSLFARSLASNGISHEMLKACRRIYFTGASSLMSLQDAAAHHLPGEHFNRFMMEQYRQIEEGRK